MAVIVLLGKSSITSLLFFDFQTHKVYETPDKFSEIANMFDGLSTATSCRLDDKDLNLDLLRRWVKHS